MSTPVAIAVPISVAFLLLVGWMTKVLSDNWTKRHLIEARLPEEVVRALFRKDIDPEMFAALKWGIVLVALGAGLVAVQALPYGVEDPLTWGVALLFAGGGLLLYYLVAGLIIRTRNERDGFRPDATRERYPDA